MNKSVETKLLFANALISISKDLPLDQIRIKDICELSGASRQTFYYHFIDKEDLLSWMLQYDFDNSLKNAKGKEGEELIEELFSNILSNDSYHRSILASNNVPSEILVEAIYKKSEDLYLTNYHKKKLNNDEVFTLKYHARGLAGLINDAINNHNPVDVKELARQEYRLLPKELKEIYR